MGSEFRIGNFRLSGHLLTAKEAPSFVDTECICYFDLYVPTTYMQVAQGTTAKAITRNAKPAKPTKQHETVDCHEQTKRPNLSR